MSKAAIATLYDDINIGNKLQNYAVQTLLRQYFDEVITLTYDEAEQTAPDIIGWKGKMAALIGFPKRIAEKKRALITRRRKFKAFSDKYLSIYPSVPFRAFNREFAMRFDYFITGSDQVWHNWTNTREELEYFTLAFVPHGKKGCIAPSFGYDVLPEKYHDLFAKSLSDFDVLSCREESGCEIIKAVTAKDAILLCDPTMVLTRDQWRLIQKKPDYTVPSKYILVYFLGGLTEEQHDEIRHIAREKHCEVVNVYDLNDLRYYTTAPDEFIWLMDHAEFVCTDSFHGLAFSILFKKQYMLFTRMDQEGKTMGNRQKTLLKMFGLPEVTTEFDDFLTTERILEKERTKYAVYLNTMLCKFHGLSQ